MKQMNYNEDMNEADSPHRQNLDENGVDLDVLDYYLALTPTERFEAFERQVAQLFEFWRENGIEHEFECEYA